MAEIIKFDLSISTLNARTSYVDTSNEDELNLMTLEAQTLYLSRNPIFILDGTTSNVNALEL